MNHLFALVTLLQESSHNDPTAAIVMIVIAIIFTVVFLALYIASIIWVYRDANRRGKSGVLVALLVALISWPIGLLVWLLIRKNI